MEVDPENRLELLDKHRKSLWMRLIFLHYPKQVVVTQSNRQV